MIERRQPPQAQVVACLVIIINQAAVFNTYLLLFNIISTI